jgi:hypothetical protein
MCGIIKVYLPLQGLALQSNLATSTATAPKSSSESTFSSRSSSTKAGNAPLQPAKFSRAISGTHRTPALLGVRMQVPVSKTLKKKASTKQKASTGSSRARAINFTDSGSETESDSVPPLVKYRYQIQEYGTDGFAEGEMRVDADLQEAQNQWRCTGKIPHGYEPSWGYKFSNEPQGKKAINFGNNESKYQEIVKQIMQNHVDIHNKVAKTKLLTPLLIFDTTTKAVSQFSCHSLGVAC